MLTAAIDLQAGHGILADHIARHHAADSQLHGQLGALPHQGAVLHFLQAADPAGVGAVILLLQFLAGEDGLLRIDDDDEVAAVGVGGVLRLQLAPQQVGGGGSGLAQRLASSIEDVPLTHDVPLVGHKSGHR